MSREQSEPADLDVDILIIGGGPAGLYATYYAGFRELRVATIDALPELGGQVSALYPEKAILDVAGFPSVKGRDLIDALVEQATQFKPQYLLDERANILNNNGDDGFTVETDAHRKIHTKTIIITGGIGTFAPRPITTALKHLGRGVSYFVTDPGEHAGKDVLIVGGGDSAFDWALHLEPTARSVTLVHRRDRFRAHAASVTRLRQSSVNLIVNADVLGTSGDQWLSTVTIKEKGSEPYSVKAQSLIAALGFTADISALESWGISMSARNISVDSQMETNVPGIYAAGDITDYPGKVRLISVGFGEAATAVNNAAHRIDPDAEIFPGHSTEQEV